MLGCFFQGVYQIDAGQVRSSDLCVTIVEVGADKALVSSYKTAPRLPREVKHLVMEGVFLLQ
jgi:hypothetical protein